MRWSIGLIVGATLFAALAQPLSANEPPAEMVAFLNAPVVMEEEVSLTKGKDYQAYFLSSNEFSIEQLANKLDIRFLGQLKEGVAVGSDVNIDIRGNRSEATLKDGQTVYYVVKIEPHVRIDRVRFVLTTQSKDPYRRTTAAMLRENYFDIKYIERIGQGASPGSGILRNDTTQGKQWMVITPAGDRYFYFSFKAVCKSAPIRTTITHHFTAGPAIVSVSPDILASGCIEIQEPLIDVPCRYPWYYYARSCSSWLSSFRRCLMADVTCVTNEHMNDPVELPSDVKTLTITGVHLPKNLTKEDIRIGAPGEVEVVALDQQGDILTAQIRILQCIPGKKEINIKGIQACDLLTFIKVITNAPNMGVRTKVFDCIRVIGTADSVPMIQRSENVHTRFAEQCWQIFNLTEVCYVDPTKATYPTSGAAGGECANAATGIVGGTCSAGGYGHTDWYAREETPATEVCDQDPAAVKITILADINGDGKIDDKDDTREKVTRGKYLCLNKDNDNGNGKPDGSEILDKDENGPIDGENDLRRAVIKLTPNVSRGSVVMIRQNGLEVWKENKKGTRVIPETAGLPPGTARRWEIGDEGDLSDLNAMMTAEGYEMWVEGLIPARDLLAMVFYFDKRDSNCLNKPKDVERDFDRVRYHVAETDLNVSAKSGAQWQAVGEENEVSKGSMTVVGSDAPSAVVRLPEPAIVPPTLGKGKAVMSVDNRGNGRVRIWEADASGKRVKEILLPATWELSKAKPPSSLLIEGTAVSSALGDIRLKLEYISGKDGIIDEGKPFACDDIVTVTVIMDMVTDMNVDGAIDVPAGSDNALEDNAANVVGRLVARNNDDDDRDGIEDIIDGANDNSNTTTGRDMNGYRSNWDDDNVDENDLAAISIRIVPGLKGKMSLEAVSGGVNINAWLHPLKGERRFVQIPFPVTYDLTTETVPSAIYVEGITAGQAKLALIYRDAEGVELFRDENLLSIFELTSDKEYYRTLWWKDPADTKLSPNEPITFTAVFKDGGGNVIPLATVEKYTRSLTWDVVREDTHRIYMLTGAAGSEERKTKVADFDPVDIKTPLASSLIGTVRLDVGWWTAAGDPIAIARKTVPIFKPDWYRRPPTIPEAHLDPAPFTTQGQRQGWGTHEQGSNCFGCHSKRRLRTLGTEWADRAAGP